MSIEIYLNRKKRIQIDTTIIIRLLLNKHLKTNNKLIPIVIDAWNVFLSILEDFEWRAWNDLCAVWCLDRVARAMKMKESMIFE